MNHACNACGMASGRKESVQRHIDNPRIHNGNAIVIPYVQYVASMAGGGHHYNIHDSFKPKGAHGFRGPHDQQVDGAFFDKIQKKVEEKTIDKVAEKMVSPTITATTAFSSLPPLSNFTYPIHQQPIRYPRENMFGISGYLCKKCFCIEPILYLYSTISTDRNTHSVLYPPNFCSGISNLRSPQDQMDYMKYNRVYGFPKALLTWIRTIWSNRQNMNLISLPIHRPISSISKHDHFQNHQHSDNGFGKDFKISRSQVGNNKDSIRVIVEQGDPMCLKKSITLYYNSSSMIQLSDVVTIEEHPDFRTTKISNAPVLMAIEKTQQLVSSEGDLLSFLSYTKISTFGFFKVRDESYLLMLVPEDYSLDRSYSSECSAPFN